LLDRHVRRICTLEDLSDVNADQAKGSRETRSIADEAAGRSELAPRIDRRNGMARCQRHDLLAPVGEERIRADDERAGVQREQRGEGISDLACGGGLHDRELESLGAGEILGDRDVPLGILIVRVDHQGDHPSVRNQLGKQFKAFRRQLVSEQADPREVPARPREAGDEA
jgi:hypothetical protein